jgi:hypothetical protein
MEGCGDEEMQSSEGEDMARSRNAKVRRWQRQRDAKIMRLSTSSNIPPYS